MPSARRMILGHVMSGLCTKMNRTKQLPADLMETPLNRCLNTFDITLLGIGHMVGAGIYVLTGTVAREMAGPAIVLSFILAGLVSLLAALCYAEFGTRVPKAGSAYVYTYVSIGEFWAFVIGWNIILEHMLGAASVARAWSGYVDSMLGNIVANVTMEITGEMHEQLLAKYPDFLACFVCLSYAVALAAGVKATAMINSILTTVNVAVMALVVVLGFWYASPDNWALPDQGFMPYGFGGVLAGAATCFYAFVGFDSIATSGEEAKNPSVSIPLATILSLCVVTVGYVLVSAALTLMIPYNEINPAAALPDAFGMRSITWAKYAISTGAICGMTTTLLGSLFALPRCLYAMASDGLLFSCFGKVNTKTQVPLLNLALSGVCSALLALLFDLEKLVEFMSIGTLLAYTIVSASVIVLRYRPISVEETVHLAPDTPGTDEEDGGGPGAPGTGAAGPVPGTMVPASAGGGIDSSSQSSTIDPSSPTSEMIEIALAGRLRPQFRWLEPVLGRCEPGVACSGAVLMFCVLSVAVCFQLENSWDELYNGTWWALGLYGFLLFCLVACVVVISAHHQNTRGLQFKVPFVPYIPTLSIFCNIELMVHLSFLTWLRFFIWLSIGMLVYFLYGIHNSKEGELGTSYSMLMSTNEAIRGWGSTNTALGGGTKITVTKIIKGRISRKTTTGDRQAIVDDDDDEDS